MYSILLTSMILGQCPNGQCPANAGPIANVVTRSRAVVHQVFSAPVQVATGGCTGARFGTPVRTFLQAAPVRSILQSRPLRTFIQEHRPHLFGHLRTGCGGAAVTVQRTFSYQRMPIANGPTTFIPVEVAPVVAPPVVAPVEGPLGHLVERVAVYRQLRKALGMSYSDSRLTPDQKDAVRKALSDPGIYDAAVVRVTHDLNARAGASGRVGKIGDGTILKLIIDNLPAIVDAIIQIIHALGG